MKMRRCLCAILLILWEESGCAWGVWKREDRKHQRAWAAFADDLSRGDCIMHSLSEKATVTLPMGRVVSKEEYESACAGSMGDSTVGETSVITKQLITVDKFSFCVEATVVTEAIAPKSGGRREVTYPAAFFVEVDQKTDQVSHIRIYAQNIALLAARGYSMVPDSSYAPIIRPV